MTMSGPDWDVRYSGAELVWSAGPNVWVAQVAAALPPGRALDLAAGEGRNAIWLAELGWQVTAVDFSAVALDRARTLAAARLPGRVGGLHTVHADLLTHELPRAAFDLVVIAYLQLPEPARRAVIAGAALAVAPGGLLLVVAHDSANLQGGFGGPQDPAVLYRPTEIADYIIGSGLQVRRAETVARQVITPAGPVSALDALLLAEAPRA
jgi:SAM-dependent methyltransferase